MTMDTSAVNIESSGASTVNIDGHKADKWIVVRGKKNGSTINYLLKTE